MDKPLRWKFSLVLMLGVALLTSACAGRKTHLKIGVTDEGEVVEAEGYSAHDPKDILATKKASLTDAQRNAVEKVVGVFVSARTMVEKAIAIENNILSRTEGYVKKYDILKEGPENGLYKTRIRALVSIKNLESDLKEMALLNTPELRRPRLSVQITEAVDGKPSSERAASSALEKALLEQGFVITTSTDKAAAEMIIDGQAVSVPFQTERLGGFVSYRARLSLQVTRPGGTDVVYSMSKEASGLGGAPSLAGLKSLETVGGLAAEELGKKLSELWGKGGRVLIFVEGVASFSEVERVRKNFSSQPGVADLVLRLYEEGMAQFEVQMGAMQPAELAARLEAGQSLPFQILESSQHLIRLKLKERVQP